jgi:hypothetical protein
MITDDCARARMNCLCVYTHSRLRLFFVFFFCLDMFIRGGVIHIYRISSSSSEFPALTEIIDVHPCNISSSTSKFPFYIQALWHIPPQF